MDFINLKQIRFKLDKQIICLIPLWKISNSY